jgi:hypothetical protein
MAIVAGINIGVDSYGLIRPYDQAPSSETLSFVNALRNATVGLPYTERDRPIKLALVQSSKADCIIVGSSHVMTFRRDSNAAISSACRSLENAGLSGASIEDTIAILGAALANPNVKHVFIGLDAWSLRINANKRWRQLASAFVAAGRVFELDLRIYDLQAGDTLDQRLAQTFSFKYLSRNWSALTQAVSSKQKALDTTASSEDDLHKIKVLRPDGSLSYPEEFLPSPDESKIVVSVQWVEAPYFDPEMVTGMTRIIQGLVTAGKSVTIVVTPYRPMTQSCPSQKLCDAIAVVEPIIRQLAADQQLDVLGGFNAADFGYKPDSFIDFQHLRGSELLHLSILPPK